MDVNVRMALPSDAEQSCQLLRRAITQCCVKDHHNNDAILNAWLENKTPEMVASWFSFAGNLSIVAVEGHRVVGIALLTHLGKILLFYVDPDRRKSGIGKMLLAHIEAYAVELELDSLQIESTVTATAFYLRHGFMYAGTKKTRFGITSIKLRKLIDISERTSRAIPVCKCSITSISEAPNDMGVT